MHFIFSVVFCLTNVNLIKGVSDISIYNLTDIFDTLLNNTTNKRIDELKEKLVVINKYVVDSDKVANIVLNVTKESNLNKTNFFKSLSENDHFSYLIENESKNLYLKLKEKINRDDVLNILAENGNTSELVKNAKKEIGEEHFGNDTDVLNEIVDKIIAEKPTDDHTFDAKDNASIYWDFQDFHQQDGRRIFKGERTTIRYYPFMASVHVMGRFWCGGVLYWHDLVLTSAACLQLTDQEKVLKSLSIKG
ncbi:hypothetical protein OBRU01_17937 [Operophtera brumata]|uniref:Peptidase S1 domain-containing protein n=1 Tax=Operophtera brumata TaxID=104452 RepID=A0A0L7KZN5_OPEBR|nr:hypothetical protein OBRU01_17937 [Operophtera brumata]